MEFEIFLIVVSLTVGQCQFLNCRWVNSLNCVSFSGTVDCGTDGKDYANRCYFAKAACKDKSIHIQADGSCASNNYFPGVKVSTAHSETTTTPTTNTPTTTTPTTEAPPSTTLVDYCTEIRHGQCTSDDKQICASDNKTYDNLCYFTKARCDNTKLHILANGPCDSSANSIPPPTVSTFCASINLQHCPTSSEILCASDNKTYQNFCLFEKARCQQGTLSILHLGHC